MSRNPPPAPSTSPGDRPASAGPRALLARLKRRLSSARARPFRPDFDAARRTLLALAGGDERSRSRDADAAPAADLRAYFQGAQRPHFFAEAASLRRMAQDLALHRPAWRERTLAQVERDRRDGLPVYGTSGPPLRPGFPWNAVPPGPGQDVLHTVRPHRFAFAPRWALAILYGAPRAGELLAVVEDWMRFAGARDNELAYLSNLVVVQRLLATTWAWALLGARPDPDDELQRLELRLLQVIATDLQFLQDRLGQSYANNHLLVDRFAGWFAAAVWPELFRGARERLEQAWLAEWQRQILPDGSGFEHALHYHEFACEMAVAYVALSRRNGWAIDAAAMERTRSMLRFQVDASGPGAFPLALGNGTEDPLFPLDADEGWGTAGLALVYRTWFGQPRSAARGQVPLGGTAAAQREGAHDPPATAQPDGGSDLERAFWLLGGEVAPDAASVPPAMPRATIYPDGGLAVLPATDGATRLTFRTGPAPGPAICGGHAHADLLGVYACVGGVPLIVDAGTYTYRSAGARWPAGEPAWRRYFAGPRAHNGLAIGDIDPLGRIDGDFRAPDPGVRVAVSRHELDGPLRWVEGVVRDGGPYDGYRRGVVDLRDGWLVYDILPRDVPADASFGFQSVPDAAVEATGRVARIAADGARMSIVASGGLSAPRVLHGQEHPPGGWVSRRYGEKVAAAQLRYDWTGTQRLTAFVLTAGEREPPREVQAVRVEGSGCAFRIEFDGRAEIVLAADEGGALPWQAFGVESDRALAWFGGDDSGMRVGGPEDGGCGTGGGMTAYAGPAVGDGRNAHEGEGMNADLALLRCPMTGSHLRVEGNRLVTEGKDLRYEIEDGILDLRCHRKDYYFNPVPRPQMDELTRRAAEVPWWRTVRTFMAHVGHNPDWLDNLVADSRYAWKLLLDLKPDATVLDLGCGLGNLTHSLAPHVGRVYAMDLTIERLRFARQRFAHFNRDDRIVLVAGGDGARLPFADRSLDVVVLSGVLEWVADDDDVTAPAGSRWNKAWRMTLSFFGDRNPRAMQTAFLREIRRVLKPDGQLFVAIENRYNQEYFRGRRDHHSGLLYGSLMPRFLANLYSIAVGKRPYRTYTYSLGGYRRLLRQAGFEEQRFFGLLPGYSHLAEITPALNGQDFWQPRSPRTRKERLVRHPRLVPAYGIVAGAHATRDDSLLARLLADVARQLATASPLRVTALRVSGKGKGLLELQAGDERSIAKLPFDEASLEGLRRQHDVVEFLCQARPELAPLLPRRRAAGRLQGVHYMVEARLPGRPAGAQPARLDHPDWLAQVAALLERMHPDPSPAVLEGDLLESEVLAPLRKIAQALDEERIVQPLQAALLERLAGTTFCVGTVHGDLTTSNLLVEDGRLSGVIDWEYGRCAGLPILDAIGYLESAQRARAPAMRIDETTTLLAERRWPVAAEWELLMRMYERLGADIDRHRELVYLYWAHHVAHQLDAGLVYDGRQIERRILRVLSRFQ